MNSDNINNPIILLGPMKVGKTTVGRLLAEKLNWPFTSLDVWERPYAIDAGFDETLAKKIQSEQGDFAWYTYRRRFFDSAVIRFLREHTHGILELGGGHPILPDTEKQARVDQALAQFNNVVLLMPEQSLEASIHRLKGRQKPERLNPDLNELLLKDGRFFKLANHVVYTQNKTPEQTCEEILNCLST